MNQPWEISKRIGLPNDDPSFPGDLARVPDVLAPMFCGKAAIIAAARHCGADMSSLQPDLERDVIVRHMNDDPQRGDQWAVFLGSEKRVELSNQQGAMVFARLLADLQQRRVWMGHGSADDLVPVSEGEVRGCPCC
jgi:hypothetical protein